MAFIITALVSVAFERVLYRRLYRASDLDQVLLTIGLAFISVAVAAYFFGTTQQPIDVPAYMRGSFDVLGLDIAAYRLFLIGVGAAITLVLVATLEYTRFGAQVRAAVDNQRMASGLGINVERTFAVTFALGRGLAGLGGALAIEIVGLDPSFRLHLPDLRADRGRRSAGSARSSARSPPPSCSASATSPANITCRSSAPF